MTDLATVKQGKATTIQDRSGKSFTEEREILNRWTVQNTALCCTITTPTDTSVLNRPPGRIIIMHNDMAVMKYQSIVGSFFDLFHSFRRSLL